MDLLSKTAFLSTAFILAASPIAPPAPQQSSIQRYRSLIDQIPASVTAISRERPSLRHEISTSYKYLRQTCPAMAHVDIRSPWNLANWMDKKISLEEWKAAPYSFRMNSFRAVSVQKNTEVKLRMLGKLYESIPSNPAFAVWVDDKIEVFSKNIVKDKFIAQETKHWRKIQKNDVRIKKYISYVGKIFVETFIPDIKVSMPDISVERRPVGFIGQFQPWTNKIRFNFSQENISIKNAKTANEAIAHEYFHFIESIIQDLSIKGLFADNSAFKEMGEKFFYSGRSDLAYVSNATDINIYQNTFKERWSYHVMRAANPPEEIYFQTRTQRWIDNNPLTQDNKHLETGRLPAACYTK